MSILMKDSGIKWIGDIPENWKVKVLKRVLAEPLKYGANEVAEFENNNHPRYIRITDFGNDGLLKDDTFKSLEPQIAEPYLLNEGDVLFARSGATVGKTFQFKNYKGKACFAGYLIKANPQSYLISSDFLYYFTKSPAYDTWKESIFTQATIQNIGADKYAYLPIVIPAIKTQKRITEFLDKATLQIDDAIKTKEKQLKTLEALKKSIIYKAVTKGLDDSVEMIDSKIEWIGNIPKYWDVKMIKRFAEVKRGASPRPIADQKYFDEDGEFAWVRIADVTASGRYLENTTQRLSELGSQYSVKQYPNDLFISIAGTVGKPIISKIKCCIHDGFVWFDNPTFNKEYLYYIFYAGLPYGGLGKLGTQLNLNTDTIGKIYIPVIPNDELPKIVEYLDTEVEKINTLKENVKKQIEKLKEYKKSLIYEYVTGKKQIKG